MTYINRLINSPVIRGFALLLGILGGLIKLLGTNFPIIGAMGTNIALYILGIYLGWVFIVLAGNWLSSSIARNAVSEIRRSEIIEKIGSEELFSKFSERISMRLSKDLILQIREELIKHPPVIDVEADNERNYSYQANRYGIGYLEFKVQCIIDIDGSAKVIRDVTMEAYSRLSKLDTFIRIPEKDSDGKLRDIEIGHIDSKDRNRELSLTVLEHRPGTTSAEMNIFPPLRTGEELQYRMYDFYLPKGLFGIDLSDDEITKRESQTDYFGWHINRPTRKFILQVYFPPERQPMSFGPQVKYAKSAGNPSDQIPTEEEKKLESPSLSRVGDRHVLTLQVDYPLSGLIYMIEWSPVSKK